MNTDLKNKTRVPEAQRPSDTNLRQPASHPSDSGNDNEPQLRDNNDHPLASQACSTHRQCNDSHAPKLVTHAPTPEQSIKVAAPVIRKCLYDVTVHRTDQRFTIIRVVAESEIAAEIQAEEIAELQPDEDWHFADRELCAASVEQVTKGGK